MSFYMDLQDSTEGARGTNFNMKGGLSTRKWLIREGEWAQQQQQDKWKLSHPQDKGK